MDIIRKNYKPEITCCPKCGHKLEYCHSTSTKQITFTQGKQFYIKNLGYICPCCHDHIYVSQTATKFAFKGIHYSTKICLIIYYYKKLGYSRERICDILSISNISISDRNVNNIYNKLEKLLQTDYTDIRETDYKETIAEFKQLRLSIDLISYNKRRLIIIRNQFTNKIIGCFYFLSIDDPKIKEILALYLKTNLPITQIISIRKDETFIPLLRQLAPNKVKFSSFLKI